ncbi:MAG: hypothetical protein M3322_00920, partial [Actinomycetota bacterium]|nr:hypothetical protein [Actinomycetota bacterium]
GPRVALSAAAVRGAVRAHVGGTDARWVRSVRFYVNGRSAAADGKAPFQTLLRRSLVGRRATATVRAQVTTTDGRSVTLTRNVRIAR